MRSSSSQDLFYLRSRRKHYPPSVYVMCMHESCRLQLCDISCVTPNLIWVIVINYVHLPCYLNRMKVLENRDKLTPCWRCEFVVKHLQYHNIRSELSDYECSFYATYNFTIRPLPQKMFYGAPGFMSNISFVQSLRTVLHTITCSCLERSHTLKCNESTPDDGIKQ